MIPTVFIFKSDSRAMRYGIGTYISELIESLLRYTRIKIYLISIYNDDVKEFVIDEISSNFTEIKIPSPIKKKANSEDAKKYYSRAIDLLLEPIISKQNNIIFHFNSSQEITLAKLFKQKYTYPIISIAHVAEWQLLFNGNKNKISDLNIEKPETFIEKFIANEREFYQLSDKIITVTQYMKDFLVTYYKISDHKITTIYNGISAHNHKKISTSQKNKIKYEWGFSKKDNIILFVGRIDEGKGIFFLLKAFFEVCKQRADLHLIFAGNGDLKRAFEQIKQFHGRIHFTGYLDKKKLEELYLISDIGILPSLYEQCPYSLLEMMDYKLPVITSKIEGIKEIYNENQCVFIEPTINRTGEISLSINEIKEAILKLTTNKKEAIQMARKAFIELSDKFSSKKMAETLYQAYISNK